MPDSFQPDSFVPDDKPSRPKLDARGRPAVSSRLSDDPEPSFIDKLVALAEPYTHPQSVSDFGRLLMLPTDPIRRAAAGGAAMGAAKSAAQSAGRGAIRGTAAVGDVVSPDAVGVVSPRAGKVLDLAQKMRSRMNASAAPAAAEAPAAPSAAPPAAAAPVSASPAPAPPAGPGLKATAAASRLKLTAEEFQAFQQLVQEGHAPEDILTAIQRNRLPQAWQGLPSDAEVAAAVADRNATGRWPQDRK